MANSLAVKKNLSSIQVLKTFMVLLEGDYTMAELVEKLNAKENKPVFNNSVVSKYINTCRYLGIEVPKINNRYFLSKLPFGLKFSDRELDLICNMQKIAEESLSVLSKKRLFSFTDKLSRYSSKNIIRVGADVENEVRKNFELAIRGKRQIRLMYRTKEILDCIPVDIINCKGKFYFVVKTSKEQKQIALDRITGLEILDKKFSDNNDEESIVIFRLKGGLAKRYTKRDNEEILEKTEDCIVVSNRGEERKELYSRLLRYDSLCEILQPVVCREEMKKLIAEMLSKYGV